MIQLKNVNIGYVLKGSPKCVLGDITFSIDEPCLVGLAGNNGTGKSTLLKTLINVLNPLSGEILINNKNITSYNSDELAKLISVVLTEKIGGFNLTVHDVIAGGRIPYLGVFGNLGDNDVKIIQQSMEAVGITELTDRLFDELSDGQKQKVLIAKSLAQQTPIILLDEPTAFLDYESRINLYVLLNDLVKKQNKTIVISSHELDILFKNANKVLYIQNNGTYLFGDANTVRSKLNF